MSTAPDHLTLAADFEPADRRAWQELVAAALRRSGRLPADAPPEAVEEALATATYDGVTVRPLYTAADAAPPAGLPGAAPVVRGPRPHGPRRGGGGPAPPPGAPPRGAPLGRGGRPDGQGWEAAPDPSSMLPTGWD